MRVPAVVGACCGGNAHIGIRFSIQVISSFNTLLLPNRLFVSRRTSLSWILLIHHQYQALGALVDPMENNECTAVVLILEPARRLPTSNEGSAESVLGGK